MNRNAYKMQVTELIADAGRITDNWDRLMRRLAQVAGTDPEAAAFLKAQAQKIHRLYKAVQVPVERISRQTCPFCREICCVRASIGFDVKDLLYLYFGGGRMPGQQIYKSARQNQPSACCHLTRNGCRLSRLERPFVCTWYLCPDQKAWAKSQGDDLETVETLFSRIKVIRAQMADALWTSMAQYHKSRA